MGAPSLLAGSPSAGALGGNPFGGQTGFGFQIPQGDPGAIESAAGSVRSLGRAIAGQGHAVRAAATASRELEAATRRGQQAWEAYQRVADQASGRLMSAAGGMRQAPEIAGGAPIPVTASASDVSLAAAMMSGLGTVPTSAAALGNPAALGGLACGPVTPGAAVAFLQQFDERQQVEQIAASDKPLDGSVWGVVPGGGQAKQFAEGAWSTTKGSFEFVTSPDQWKQAVNGLLQSSPVYRQVFDHEDPMTAQMRAQQTSDGIVKGMVDWQDFSHGRIARGLGAVTAGALEAKGLDLAVPKIAAAVRTDPSWGAGMGMKTLGAAGVPHAGDLTDVASQMANRDVRRMLDTYAHTYASAARGRVLRGAATVGATYTLTRALDDPAVLQRMSELPVHPQVIVVPHPPQPRLPHPIVHIHDR